ncbi:IS1182 family transposase [Clostridium sp. JN-9]|jgi:transposase|uniref:IS1182 family transposase n=1 Tax=Clostridium sp. JN-9 TaxID=2507159 RepID=UPI000FFE0687|nr:IS1182 family transposase [Clostridium sp. JN-9]QAT39107.1 IS1182 family transposase [Clostridium sp. JN-9]QAT39654.1 IS1182 family transposase [Clostridium sp. JN-9]QAT39761.1 IS1182 family transposase [Clostridium sp. JN-9]QAT39781.1 IS1182 family transposase [Clostridium sp. JN-9]QAT40426.1 IS1182 family transposase [Clostridium sp. JN-9]
MRKYINSHKNYTLYRGNYQLKLPLNIEYMIPNNDSVRLLSQFVEEMDLTDLYSTYSRIRENQATPRQMLKIVLYSYMNHNYSSRAMELSCKRDVNFMYLLEGSPAPDHSTFARFRSIHFAPCSETIMAEMSNFLYEIGEISGDTIFIDGTKIEACANKYTFVWKKAVSKNLERLLSKLADFVAECEELYGIKLVYENKVKMKHVKKLRKKLYALKKEENIEFVHGCGKRKTPIQRSIEKLEEYLRKLKEYTQKIHTCGKRNSYSKTDKDATFMRMKEDAMKNGQLKPGYNVQNGVDSQYIVWVTVCDKPGDTTTLIPFIKSMENSLYFKYFKIDADSGYESEENYLYIKENGQLSYIKPANYEISKTRKYKHDISRIENMDYTELGDYYTCKNNKKLTVNKIVKRKSKTGYISEKTIYTCEDCSNCVYKSKCIRGHNCKTPLEERVKNLETSKLFNMLRKEDLERIISDDGCELRMNRSIQAEGSFGEIKQDMGFRRYLCKGKKNVLAESILLAMAHNINKLHNKIQLDRTETHLFPLKKGA